MHVICASEIHISSDFSNRQIKQQLGQFFTCLPRRIDRTTWQMLLACAPMQPHIHPHCGVYLAANYPSPDTMTSMLNSVCIEQLQPKPFEFVNSVSNAAGFYLARQLGLEGPNLFISYGPQVWQHLVRLAHCDFLTGNCQQALLLACDNPDTALLQAVLIENRQHQLISASSFARLTEGITPQHLSF